MRKWKKDKPRWFYIEVPKTFDYPHTYCFSKDSLWNTCELAGLVIDTFEEGEYLKVLAEVRDG